MARSAPLVAVVRPSVAWEMLTMPLSEHLTSMMPDYIAKAYGAADEVQKRYEA